MITTKFPYKRYSTTSSKMYNWKLEHWGILGNHYHLLCHSRKGRNSSRIINKPYNISAQTIKSKHNFTGKVWSNYWDYCPRDEHDYYPHFCYFLNNPYKLFILLYFFG
ncbi:MAG TPA: hypothetical protein EYG68_07040 [Leucothrix mucor]|nr:hypothetical protein [Leucothrix mucor]